MVVANTATIAASVKYALALPAPPKATSARGITIPIMPVIVLDVVWVEPIIALRSFMFLVIAAGSDQKGISTAVKTTSTTMYMTQA